MAIIYRLFIVFFLLLSLSTIAQTKREKAINKEVEKAFDLPESVKIPEDYKEASVLIDSALDLLQKGEVNEADKRIRQSIAIYPTVRVFEYIKQICLMSDINKARLIMEELYVKVASLPTDTILLLDSNAFMTEKGVKVKKVRPIDKERVLFVYAYNISNINKEFGDINHFVQSLKKMLSIHFKPNNATDMDIELFTQEASEITLATIEKDYSRAIKLIEGSKETKVNDASRRKTQIAGIYIESGEYEKALDEIKNLPPLYEGVGAKLSFMANALLGRNEQALLDYKKYTSFEYNIIFNDMYYYLAIIDLNKKEFDKALVNLDKALNKKMGGIYEGLGVEGLSIEKHKVYKAMGDAHTGLKQFDKAKDYYSLSLLFYPDYEPTKSAIVLLKSLMVKTTATDKTPPVISVTEPSVKRGLEIVTAGTDILVRGTAQDPSGLKAVTINGQLVFSQSDGNFWGNIVLKEGINKIIVKATDGAGNSAEQSFNIEKKANVAASDIVPVTTKEGKNYCLLIGAQNYEDINIPSLENPIQDAVRLKLILKKDYDFEEGTIFTLFNPGANDVKRKLLELITIIQPEDNLLIFYAGHGIWVEKEKKGYWLLVDAKRNDSTTWLQNKDVLNLIAKLPSRHTLLITDACFSGGVFKSRSIGKDAPAALKTINEKISRVAITSGNDTEVPDESVFMKYLVKALTENKEKYLTAQKMFITQIMEAVMTETKTEPRYGTLELAGHIGGDYIFSKK
jgi:tetratricopeptide (TPR) repeat protein